MSEQLRPYRAIQRDQATGRVIRTQEMTADEYDRRMRREPRRSEAEGNE
jgi:hypothetical protein